MTELAAEILAFNLLAFMLLFFIKLNANCSLILKLNYHNKMLDKKTLFIYQTIIITKTFLPITHEISKMW